ncbi:ubiquitin-like protein [Cryptosporidium canis]|uniref:Ubiquitin-like protein n=1 Tax=Cryptosporidium canis TaxID=195482 RepID=A0A9D5DMF4_9CRYT|nr:ubiquitin-like protein [Cryptosporidium canis]
MVNPNDDEININVKLLNGDVIKIPNKIDVKKTSVLKLKEIISNLCNIPAIEIRLVWKDKVLSNNSPLDSYGIEDNCTLILARSPSRSLDTSSSSSSSQFSGMMNPFSLITPRQEPGSLFGEPNMDDFLSSALASPWMQSILSDPEVFRMILDSNPQLKALREQNPELNHIFNDPQFLQMSVDVLKNPELMKEMMRNSDRAISNIESIPGGFSALKRMYHTVQEPMWDAAMYNNSDNRKSNANHQYNIDKSSGPNSEALPNPWNSNKNSNCHSNNPEENSSSPSPSPSPLDIFERFNQNIIPGANQSPMGLFPFDFGTRDPTDNNNNNSNIGLDASNNFLLPELANLGNFPNIGTLNPNANQNPLTESNGNSNNDFQSLPQLPNILNMYPPFPANGSNTIQTVIDAMRNMNINNGNNILQNQANAIFRNNTGDINTGNYPPTNANNTHIPNPENPPVNNSNNQNYNYQLEVLSSMGFTDTEACIKALSESDGSINRAIDKLLNPN